MKKGQLYLQADNVTVHGINFENTRTCIILVSGIVKDGRHKGCYSVWYVATGENVNACFNRCYFFPALVDTGWGPWVPIQIPDLLRYLNLPKKSVLFDRLLSGGSH